MGAHSKSGYLVVEGHWDITTIDEEDVLEDFVKHKDERIQKVQTEKLSYKASLDEMEKEKKGTCLWSVDWRWLLDWKLLLRRKKI